MNNLKRWKHKGNPLLIPEQHEPGKQRGYFGSPKKKGRRQSTAQDPGVSGRRGKH